MAVAAWLLDDISASFGADARLKRMSRIAAVLLPFLLALALSAAADVIEEEADDGEGDTPYPLLRADANVGVLVLVTVCGSRNIFEIRVAAMLACVVRGETFGEDAEAEAAAASDDAVVA